MYKQAHNNIYVVWNGGGHLRSKVLSNPLRNMKQDLYFFLLGAANNSHSCLAIPLVLSGPLEGIVVSQHRGRALQAAPAHAPSWRVPDALGKIHS